MTERTTDQILYLIEEYRLDGTELDGLEIDCPHPLCDWRTTSNDLEWPHTLRAILSTIIDHENTTHPDTIRI